MLTFSEAIRLGSSLKPQAHHSSKDTPLADCVAICAIEAAALAVGCVGTLSTLAYERWPWPWSIGDLYSCPQCQHVVGNAAFVMSHLNDHHWWSRERIADWVEGLEHARAQRQAVIEPELVGQ